jgi:nucleoside-diphosphate-sugar epimerase
MLHNMPITGFSKSTRSFLYIDDWTNAVANVLHNLPCDTFNIASTEQVDMRALIEIIRQEIPETASEIIYRDYEPENVAHKCADVTKATAQLGLQQTFTLAMGVRQTVLWQRHEYGR